MAEPLTPQQEIELDITQVIIRSGAPYSVALAAARKVCICLLAMLHADEGIDESEVAAVCATFTPTLLHHEARPFVKMIHKRRQTRRAPH